MCDEYSVLGPVVNLNDLKVFYYLQIKLMKNQARSKSGTPKSKRPPSAKRQSVTDDAAMQAPEESKQA